MGVHDDKLVALQTDLVDDGIPGVLIDGLGVDVCDAQPPYAVRDSNGVCSALFARSVNARDGRIAKVDRQECIACADVQRPQEGDTHAEILCHLDGSGDGTLADIGTVGADNNPDDGLQRSLFTFLAAHDQRGRGG